MIDDKLIYVVGTPSGGTSIVAGMLHHLGVDMGDWLPKPGVRGYITYEDRLSHEMVTEVAGDGPAILRQRLDLRAYLAERRRLNPDGLLGVKGSSLWWLDDAEPETLPIKVVRVSRALQDAIRSDQRITGQIHETVDRLRDKLPWDARQRVEFAGRIGAAWWACEELCRIHRAIVDVPHHASLEDPMCVVGELSRKVLLGSVSLQQKQAAADIVIPPKTRFGDW